MSAGGRHRLFLQAVITSLFYIIPLTSIKKEKTRVSHGVRDTDTSPSPPPFCGLISRITDCTDLLSKPQLEFSCFGGEKSPDSAPSMI